MFYLQAYAASYRLLGGRFFCLCSSKKKNPRSKKFNSLGNVHYHISNSTGRISLSVLGTVRNPTFLCLKESVYKVNKSGTNIEEERERLLYKHVCEKSRHSKADGHQYVTTSPPSRPHSGLPETISSICVVCVSTSPQA